MNLHVLRSAFMLTKLLKKNLDVIENLQLLETLPPIESGREVTIIPHILKKNLKTHKLECHTVLLNDNHIYFCLILQGASTGQSF